MSRYSIKPTRPSISMDSPVKNWRSLNLERTSFITLLMLFLKTSTWSGQSCSSLGINLKINNSLRITSLNYLVKKILKLKNILNFTQFITNIKCNKLITV